MITLNAPSAPATGAPDAPKGDPAAARHGHRGTKAPAAPFAQLLGIALEQAAPEPKGVPADPNASGEESRRDARPEEASALAASAPAAPALAIATLPVAVVAPAAARGTAIDADAPKTVATSAAESPAGGATTNPAAARDERTAPGVTDAPAATPVPARRAPEADRGSLPTAAADTARAVTASTPAAAAAAPDVAAASAALAPARPAALDAAPMHARVDPPVGSAAFPEAFAAEVRVAVHRGVESASIEVNPPELGPVEVRIELSNGEAQVHIAAEHAVTREAIADALPRLRELLESQGLALGQGSLGSELPQREAPRGAAHAGPDAPRTATGGAEEPAPPPARAVSLRLLDVYA